MSEHGPERTDAAATDGGQEPRGEGRRVLDVPAFQYADVRPPEDPTAAPAEPEQARPPRRRGRPPGSRNRPRAAPTARPPGRPRRRTRAAGGEGSLDAVTAELVESVRALAEAVERQDRELAELRARMDGIRRFLE